MRKIYSSFLKRRYLMEKKRKELGSWHDWMIFCRGFSGVAGIIAAVILAVCYIFRPEPAILIIFLATLALAVYSLDVREDLQDLKEGAPRKLINYHVFAMIIGIVDAFAEFFIGPLSSDDALDVRSLIGSIFHGIIMIAINSSYYGNRSHMFEDSEEEEA